MYNCLYHQIYYKICINYKYSHDNLLKTSWAFTIYPRKASLVPKTLFAQRKHWQLSLFWWFGVINTIIWGQVAGKKPFKIVTKLIFTGFVINKAFDIHARSEDPFWAISHHSPSQPAKEIQCNQTSQQTVQRLWDWLNLQHGCVYCASSELAVSVC